MANIQSKIKRNKQNEKERARNKSFKSEVRTAIKLASNAIDNKEKNSTDLVNTAISLIDKSTVKGIFHANKSARLKSKLMKKAA